MLDEAWKADLNYIPPTPEIERGRLMPHELIETEVVEEQRKAEEVWAILVALLMHF